jgi:membrane protease YdiL (CAAX protease family)
MTRILGLGRRVAWREAPETPDRPPLAALATLGLLLAWNVFANLAVPDWLDVPVNLAAAAGLVLIARRLADASWSDLGLTSQHLLNSLRLRALIVTAVATLVVLASLASPIREVLGDGRFSDVGDGEMAYQTLVRIPLATAFAEELAFRGVLVAVLLMWMSPLRALLVSSALFGLWHILPGIAALDTTSTLEAGESGASMVSAVAGQVLITAIAGAAFCWLRLRSGHLAASVLAHWGLNGVAYFVGWQIVRNGWV